MESALVSAWSCRFVPVQLPLVQSLGGLEREEQKGRGEDESRRGERNLYERRRGKLGI